MSAITEQRAKQGTDVTVTIQPEHLPALMHEFSMAISSDLDDPVDNITSPSNFETIRQALERWEPRFEQIHWGQSDTTVTVTLPREELADFASALIESGADMVGSEVRGEGGVPTIDGVKSRLGRLYAGLSIAEQLDAVHT